MNMNKNIVPVFFACDDNFVKFTYVTLKSIMENASKDYFYKVYVLNTNISEDMKKIGFDVASEYENCELIFADVTDYLDSIKDRLPLRDYYSKTTYFRLFIAEMYPEYDKAIYIDSDTIVEGDFAELYNHNLGNNLVGACNEQAMVQTDIYGTYCEKCVGVDRNHFFNAGMLVINCDLFRKENVLDQFIELLGKVNFAVTQDEDYLNYICQDRVLWIDNSWNVEVYGEIKYSDSEINMIHYIMWAKPWHFDNARLQDHFWKYAKMTPVYKDILAILNSYTDEEKKRDLEQADKLAKLAQSEINRSDYFACIKKKITCSRLNA